MSISERFQPALTDEELLEFLVAVVDAELLEAVVVEDLEAVDVEDADDGVLGAVPPAVLLHLDGGVHLLDDPGEQALVDGLRAEVSQSGQLDDPREHDSQLTRQVRSGHVGQSWIIQSGTLGGPSEAQVSQLPYHDLTQAG